MAIDEEQPPSRDPKSTSAIGIFLQYAVPAVWLIILVSVIAIIATLGWEGTAKLIFDAAKVDPVISGSVLFPLAIFTMIIPLPAPILFMILLGFFCGFWVGMALNIVAQIIALLGVILLVHLCGCVREWIEETPALRTVVQVLEREDTKFVVLLRFILMHPAIKNYAVAALSIPTWRIVALSLPGVLWYSFFWAYLGSLAERFVEGLRRGDTSDVFSGYEFVIFGVSIVATVGIAIFGYQEYMKHGDTTELQRLDPPVRLTRAQAIVAHSKLRTISVSIMICLMTFFIILIARLELQNSFQWPFYVDLLPLWILPVFLYLMAADFAATRISTDAALGKMVVVTCGFLIALCMLFLTTSVVMKLTYVVNWTWFGLFTPIWCAVLTAQMFLCFLTPGFVRSDMLSVLLVLFCSIWLAALTVLLVSLKLDGVLSYWAWTYTLIPLWVALVSQMIAFPPNFMDIGARALLLVVTVLLGLQLDQVVHVPWVVVFGPVLFLLFVNALLIGFGVDRSENDPAPK